MGAQVPRAAFASASELSDALSVRGDKSNAMRCRKKQRDALSVRTLGYGVGDDGLAFFFQQFNQPPLLPHQRVNLRRLPVKKRDSSLDTTGGLPAISRFALES
jgi:hypothetical protein